MERYLPTGNAFLSLPKINEQTAGIEDLTFLSMQHKGMIEIRGGEELPLIRPFLQADGHRLPLTQMQWSRDSFWLPVHSPAPQWHHGYAALSHLKLFVFH